MKLRLCWALVLITTSAAATLEAREIRSQRVERVNTRTLDETDRFTGTRVISATKPIDLRGGGMLTTLSLSPAIRIPEGQPPILYAAIRYRGPGWAYLNGKVDFVIDGQRYSTTGTDSSGHREIVTCASPGDCIVQEIARVPLDPELASAISNARRAEVRFSGDRWSQEGTLTETHVAYFRDIFRRYQDLASVAPEEAIASDEGGDHSAEQAKVDDRPL